MGKRRFQNTLITNESIEIIKEVVSQQEGGACTTSMIGVAMAERMS